MAFQTRNKILNLLINRSAIGCCALLTFQQILESSSTYWLVLLMASVAAGTNFIPLLVIYLLTLIFSYLPLCIAYIFKISWRQETQRAFTNAFIASNKDNIGEWSNKGLKEQKLSILSAEGPQTIYVFIDYIWNLITYVLSVFLNIVALSIVVEPLFAAAYSVSLTCVFIVMKMKRRAQRQLTKKALTARIDLCQSLLAAWDNVLLGNAYNFKLWDEKTTQSLNRCLQRNVALERFDQYLAIFVTIVTAIPSLVVVAYFVATHLENPVELSAFIVILPTLFLILSYTHQTLTLIFQWGMHKSRLTSLYGAIQGTKESHEVMEKKIKWGKLILTRTETAASDSVSHASTQTQAQAQTQMQAQAPAQPQSQPIFSHHDVMQYTSTSGRFTIRGDNGSGKSTTLMLIKRALANRAFFLPTQNQLSFLSETNKYSTGESLKNRLLEILEKVDVDVLLLDEWDANLDKENRERLSALIDELSTKKCVIEVRHR